MPADDAEVTAGLMTEADLRGVDSHGISMLPSYERQIAEGRMRPRAEAQIVRESPATALIDAAAGFGHPVSARAMNLAVDKCLTTGVAVVSVVNSSHFGAAGAYSSIASERGCIGMVTSATRGVLMVPTFAAEAVMGTNPVAFAAPGGRNPSFELDMATTTVAMNRVKVHELTGTPLPEGWVVDGAGRPVTDPEKAMRLLEEESGGGLTPLGIDRELGGHKGYGLAVMVHILGGVLSGASFSPVRNRTQKPGDPNDLGHFFLAIDPRAFRQEGEFERDLDEVIDTLHGAAPSAPGRPVQVAGDPERATREERVRDGVPLPDDLVALVRAIAGRTGADVVLEPVSRRRARSRA
jgi:LDH2 family malate/lactate/ureidoglycolate dehydrogenase